MRLGGRSYFHYLSPYGPLTIGRCGDAITRVALDALELEGERKPHELTNRASTEILEYLAGKRRVFDLALAPAGTPFEQTVWAEIAALSFGEQITTRELAERLGQGKSYRRVGAAVNANPIAVLIPSHRIVTAPGKPRLSDPYATIAAALLTLETP